MAYRLILVGLNLKINLDAKILGIKNEYMDDTKGIQYMGKMALILSVLLLNYPSMKVNI